MSKKSMTYTNGRILVNSKADPEALSQEARKLMRYLDEECAIQAEVLLDDSVAYPCYIVPPGITWDQIEQALRPSVQLKAINEDVIVLPETRVISQKHYFSEDEKEKMANDMAKKVVEKLKLESKKAAIMKEYKAKIDGLDEEVNEIGIKYAAGHEDRDHVCVQKLDFASGIKYFVGKDDDEIYKSEPLEGTDRQLRIDTFKEPGLNPADLYEEPASPSERYLDNHDGPEDATSDTASGLSEPDGSPFPPKDEPPI
jgi:hypothetical protein